MASGYPGVPKPKKTKGSKPVNYGKWYQGTGDFGTATYQGHTFPQLNIPWAGPVSYGLSGQYPPMYGSQYKPPSGATTTAPGPMPNQGYAPGFMYGAQGGVGQQVGQANQPPMVYGSTGGWQTPGTGPFGWRQYDPDWNPYAGAYENPNQPGQWGGWRANPNYDPNNPSGPAYEFTSTGTERTPYGQPAGTPGPLNVRGPRRIGSFAQAYNGPIDYGSQIAQTQAMIDALTARQQAQPKRNNRETHWNPSAKQMGLLQRRLAMLQNAYGNGGNVGVQYAGGGGMTSWRA